MKISKVLLILLFILPFIPVIFTLGSFVLWSFIDSPWYYSEAVNLGPVDYNAELTKAEEAGYTVRGSWPWPGNTHPGFGPMEVVEVKEKFGNATIVQEVRLYYDSNSELVVYKYDGQPETYLAPINTTNKNLNSFLKPSGISEEEQKPGTYFVFTNTTHQDLNLPLKPSEFPEEGWMLEMIGLLFDRDETASRFYLTELKAASQNQTWDAMIPVSESLDFPAVYSYLQKNSTISRQDNTGILTQGSDAEEIFFKNETRLGYIKYFIPTAEVETFDNGNQYKLELRASGDVELKIIMPKGSRGETIPEEEYRTVFREMFENIGLPPEAIDEFEFSYSSSRVW